WGPDRDRRGQEGPRYPGPDPGHRPPLRVQQVAIAVGPIPWPGAREREPPVGSNLASSGSGAHIAEGVSRPWDGGARSNSASGFRPPEHGLPANRPSGTGHQDSP